MTMDMTVKEYAYFILVREDKIRESTLRRRLLEVYREACVDCILREIREDPRVTCIQEYSTEEEEDCMFILQPRNVDDKYLCP